MNEITPDRIARINSLFEDIEGTLEQVKRLQDNAVEKACELGGLLTEAKNAAGHGNWIPWCEANLSFDVRTAQRYMRVFAKYDTVSHLESTTDAYRALTDTTPEEEPKPTPAPEPAPIVIEAEEPEPTPAPEPGPVIIEAEEPEEEEEDERPDAHEIAEEIASLFGQLPEGMQHSVLSRLKEMIQPATEDDEEPTPETVAAALKPLLPATRFVFRHDDEKVEAEDKFYRVAFTLTPGANGWNLSERDMEEEDATPSEATQFGRGQTAAQIARGAAERITED